MGDLKTYLSIFKISNPGAEFSEILKSISFDLSQQYQQSDWLRMYVT